MKPIILVSHLKNINIEPKAWKNKVFVQSYIWSRGAKVWTQAVYLQSLFFPNSPLTC